MVMDFLKPRKKKIDFLKPPTNLALEALRLKRGEIKETEVTNPKVLEMARITPYQDLEKMAGKLKMVKEMKPLPKIALKKLRISPRR